MTPRFDVRIYGAHAAFWLAFGVGDVVALPRAARPGHRLATGGPFRVIRHPIYAALDLLALGTAPWAPMP